MPEREERGAPGAAAQPQTNRPVTVKLKRREARIIFAEMVKAEMQAGLLRYSKRRQLVRHAAKMGIAEFEAHLIMAQVRSTDGQRAPLRLLTPEEIQAKLKEAQQHNLTIRKILIATAAAAMLNLLTIHWLFS